MYIAATYARHCPRCFAVSNKARSHTQAFYIQSLVSDSSAILWEPPAGGTFTEGVRFCIILRGGNETCDWSCPCPYSSFVPLILQITFHQLLVREKELQESEIILAEGKREEGPNICLLFSYSSSLHWVSPMCLGRGGSSVQIQTDRGSVFLKTGILRISCSLTLIWWKRERHGGMHVRDCYGSGPEVVSSLLLTFHQLELHPMAIS